MITMPARLRRQARTVGMRSLDDIRSEFFDQLEQKDSELLVKVRQAEGEKDALLQRAGLRDGPDDLFADDACRWSNDAYYRSRVREMVFEVADGELRRQIMGKIHDYREALYDRWRQLHSFESQFAGNLVTERCRVLPFPSVYLIAIPLAGLYILYWFGGTLDALILGLGIVLAALFFFLLHHVADLHHHDVIMQEAIKLVDRNAAEAKRETVRRLQLPEIFSSRERRTGEKYVEGETSDT